MGMSAELLGVVDKVVDRWMSAMGYGVLYTFGYKKLRIS